MAHQLSNNEIAQAFVEDVEIIDNIVFHEEYKTFFIYKDGRYNKLSPRKMDKVVFNFIRTRFPSQKIHKNLIKDVIYQVEMLCFRQEEMENDRYISFKDVLFDLETFKTIPKDTSIFTLFHIDYNYIETEETKTENWLRFLESSLVDEDGNTDNALIKLVQEMFGFFFLGGLKGYKAWFLIGEGSNGKGVMSRVLSNIFGDKNISAMSIEDLSVSKYNAAELIGKKLNISNEDESKYIVSSKFKAIVAGDPIHCEVKYGPGITFKPRTKFAFCSNKKPVFQDLDYGIKRRLMFIPFNRIFRDGDIDKDLDIDSKLVKETPGIIKWALEGAKRLKENNYVYSQSKLSDKLMIDFEEAILSSVMFAREYYVVDDESSINGRELYDHYRQYCIDINKKAYSYPNFREHIKSSILGVKDINTSINYKHIRGFNLCLKEEYEKRVNELFSKDIVEEPIQKQDSWTDK